MTKHTFPHNDPKQSISEQEVETLQFWKDKEIFQKSVESRNPAFSYKFFDGPPFATGTPHYGHILAGAIKDAIPRYKTMQGYRVERKWGWDCHGVPVEFQVEKEHQIGGKPGIEKMGVGKFNELCRSVVLRCADQWRETVARMGRFVDFENDYKTMDPKFMESVWWVFNQLWDKGLIYEGEKVVAYSPKLGSPLSNFEANLNYSDIDDPSAVVEFEIIRNPDDLDDNEWTMSEILRPIEIKNTGSKEERNEQIKKSEEEFNKKIQNKKIFFLAWTTTPWTLPSNLGLAVKKGIQYSLVESGGKLYILASNTIKNVFKNRDYKTLSERVSISSFIGKKYKPLFPFFKDHENAFQILEDEFVSDSDGTGIVHMAPNFGEEDARVCHENGIKYLAPNPIDENGYFESEKFPKDLNGLYFRSDPHVEGSKENNANKWVINALKESGKIFEQKQVRHSYPHCWRTDCALMYRGIKTWFVNVQKIKEKMISENQNINWLPEHLKNGRFGKMLESAPDWAISRNRYWGCPIPVWKCSITGNTQVVSSRSQLQTLCGKDVDDLHKHFVDKLTWKSPFHEDGIMERIEEVLDCWFESGAMPYASVHYPFNEKNTEDSSPDKEIEGFEFQPADFIAEGLDQTRGWFYTLHVLGCALFGKNIYKNVITNGIILAEDGQKMSKSKQNYPDPNLIFEKYGADAMRFYLLSSPVVKGENFRFAERGVEEILKSVLLPLKSTYQFLSTYANIDSWKPTKFVFVRHGEGEHNTAKVYSGKHQVPHSLTPLGISQVEEIAPELPEFDEIISSPFLRTQETAEIIKNLRNFSGEILHDERVQEPYFGNLEGKNWIPPLKRYENASTEHPLKVQERVNEFIGDISQKHRGKTILVTSHGSPIRNAEAYQTHTESLEDMIRIPYAETGKYRTIFAHPESKNELDLWILSELQTLLKAYRENFDAYDLEGALRLIAPFVDNLNNWYLRRSRRRFWASGMDEDKIGGYETLHHVLLVLSKILAPICPFFAEKLFQDLGGSGSVHLEYMPHANETWILESEQEKVSITREIVSLAAGIRARAKVKLRQPLAKLSFSSTSTAEVDLEIIKAEANVKEVEIIPEKRLKEVAQKIVRVNARVVGKKFGSKVQELIKAGKAGKFIEKENGIVEICSEEIFPGEYEVGFITEEGVEAEATIRTVVLLDTELTDDLIIEGFAREIIRSVQDMRKTNGFEIADRITVSYDSESEKIQKAFTKFSGKISEETLATTISQERHDGVEIEIDGEKMTMKVEKV